MKTVVVRSVPDASGDRRVDGLRWPADGFGRDECRRDPEDSHGCRRRRPTRSASREAATAEAARAAGRMGRGG